MDIALSSFYADSVVANCGYVIFVLRFAIQEEYSPLVADDSMRPSGRLRSGSDECDCDLSRELVIRAEWQLNFLVYVILLYVHTISLARFWPEL